MFQKNVNEENILTMPDPAHSFFKMAGIWYFSKITELHAIVQTTSIPWDEVKKAESAIQDQETLWSVMETQHNSMGIR